MYRAKVEQINGVNVRAGGKWLKCIGNKNFHVGDYVYTDGRCAYGYDKESMSPFVPTQGKEEIVIPVFIKKLVENSSEGSHFEYWLYVYRKNSKEPIKSLELDFFNFDPYDVSKNRFNLWRITNNKKKIFSGVCSMGRRFSDGTYSRLLHNISNFSVNIDNEGNHYIIYIIEDRYEGTLGTYSGISDLNIIIKKNNEIVVEKKISNVQRFVVGDTAHLDDYTFFIENEKKWWVVYSDAETPPDPIRLPDYKNSYVVSQDGQRELQGAKLPIDNGFYITCDNIKTTTTTNRRRAIENVGVTIYTPKEQKLVHLTLTDDSPRSQPLNQRLIVYQLNDKRFLLGMCHSANSFNGKDTLYLYNGEEREELLKDVYIANQCLRPMFKKTLMKILKGEIDYNEVDDDAWLWEWWYEKK